MKKLPASISQELDLLKQNTLEKLSLPDGSLDDLFSMFVQSQAEVLRLKEELSLMRMRLFGKRSEKQATNEEDPQMRMFDEAEHSVATATDEEQQADAEQESALPEATISVAAEQPKSQPARGKRKPLPAELPRVEVVHELPEHEQHCECGCQKHVIGEETSEQLEIIPQRVQVIRHVRKVYGCKACETAPKTAAKPAQFIEKIMATPSVLSMLLTTKFVDGISLEQSDFRARVYEVDKDLYGDVMPDHIVAFKGTSSGEDWKNNFQQGVNLHSDYYEQTVNIGKKLEATPANVEIVGHSLGGGMASAASQASGKPATTFNASGLHKKTVARYGGSVNDSSITAYRVKDEVLTGLQEPGWKSLTAGFALGGIKGAAAVFGLGLLMPNAADEHIQTPKISTNPVYGHFMDDVLASFRQLIDEDEQALAKATGHTCAWAS